MITRVVSALIAVAVVIAATLFFKAQGLYVVCSLAVLGCVLEYSRLTLAKAKAPLHFQIAFMALAGAVYALTVISSELLVLILTSSAVILFAMGITGVRRSLDLGHTFKLQSAAIVGLFYVGLFPGLAIALLGLPNGLTYFFGLLGIVFTGDTFAYFFGRWLGKAKLLEAVSPNKTIAGSYGGLFGSALAGLILSAFFIPGASVVHMILIAIVSGAFAQVGDLFESLVKRLADVKDSGRIMPGHGGFLDRLDGVLFAAPVYYVLLRFLT